MLADNPFMPWINHLHEVGDPIQIERDKLLALAQRALDLEREACALRDQVTIGQAALVLKVMKHWTLADIQDACEKVRQLDPMAAFRAQVDDSALRERINALDGWHLASEALQIFDQAGVLRQHNLLSTATEEERAQALGRVLAWWAHVGRPVCERLSVK
jgi:hypothetical protein